MLLDAAHESREVGRTWYAVGALVLLVLCDIFSKAASLDGMPLLSAAMIVFFSAAAIKTLQLLDAQGVWGRASWRDAAFFVAAVVLMQGIWLSIGWGEVTRILPADGILIGLFVIVVAAPVFEEVIFRGLLHRVFEVGAGRAAVAVQVTLSATAFAAFHVAYWQTWALALVFVAGLIFAIARVRSGGILLPIALHALMNAVAVGVSMWR